MKPSRQFRPLAHDALEDRIAPSQIAAGVHPTAAKAHQQPAAHVRAGGHARAGAGAKVAFPMNIADTIAAGLPVEEQRTTRLGPGATQTETRLIQPNNTNSTTLTNETINLPRNGGTENVTDFSYVQADGSTVHVITTNLPDGSIETENKSVQTMGGTSQFSATVKLPNNGGIRAITGSSVDSGPVTTTDETVTEPDGTVHHDHTVVVHRGEMRETETKTVTQANGTHQVTRSTTTIARAQPPTATSAGTAVPGGGTATPPKLA